MNDERYFTEKTAANLRGHRRYNFEATPLSKPKSTSDYISYEFLTMIETRKIYFSEELFMCYGSYYIF